MTELELKEVFDRLSAKMRRQELACQRVDSWLRPELETGFDLPPKATHEHRALSALSRTPWLLLVVSNVVQAMYVDGVEGDGGPVEEAWRLWMANDMSVQQIANHRAMIAYGHSYGVVSHSETRGKSKISFLSPCHMAVEYEGRGLGEYPSAALEALNTEGKRTQYRLRVPGRDYVVEQEPYPSDAELGGFKVVEERSTGVSIVPVVRFANQVDLQGRTMGDVEPFIPTAQRINKTAYDRLLAQHFNSWKVKTATGLELPSLLDEDGDPTEETDTVKAEELRLKLAQDDVLIGESPETKFSTLDATALDPFVSSWRSDIEALAAVSQTPAYALTGQLVNLSAEALAAARAPLMQKVHERQVSAGASYSRLLRTAAHMAGMEDIAQDDLLRVTWQDTEIRSLSQAADALGKLGQMLGVPVEALWQMIPGVERSQVAEWVRIKEEEAEKAVERDPMTAVARRHGIASAEGVSGGEDR